MVLRTSDRIPGLRKLHLATSCISYKRTVAYKFKISKHKWNEAITGSHEKTQWERNKIGGNTMTVESAKIVNNIGFVHPWKGNIQLCWLKDNTPCLFAPRDNVCEPVMVEEMSTLILLVLLLAAWIWLHQWPKKSQSEMKVHYLEKKWPGERRNANSYSRSPPLRCWGDQPLADVRYQHCL